MEGTPDVASLRLNRKPRWALAVAVVLAVVGGIGAPAMAAPSSPAPNSSTPAPPTTADQALQQYKQLADQAEQLNQDYLQAESDLQTKQQQLNKANADYAQAEKAQKQAKAEQDKYQSTVDQLSQASFEGARFNQMSALLTGDSAKDFLDQASALQVLSNNNYAVLSKYQAATDKATNAANKASDAKQRAQDAYNAKQQLIQVDIPKRNQALQQQASVVETALQKLSPDAMAQLHSKGDMSAFIPPPGPVGVAMAAALSKRGDPYVWGATGPDSFDCSGLMLWSFHQAGINLPRTSQAQSQVGTPISRDQLQPGDLVFFGNPVHHVGMYVGNGEMVNAPTFGEPVQVDPIFHDYSGARRIVAQPQS
ncbi:MAG: C40 family peptidase [Sciscionella sp.]|nr:C40 family peptidase [Sciscionella sp.]